MNELRKKKEFLYLLDGKYYIIGRCECKECDDEELISLYQEFLFLTDDELFKEFNPHEMWKVHRNKVADVYKMILDACHVPIEQCEMTDEKVLLRERLEEKYEAEIKGQIERWLKADTCATYKEIAEKQG
jgi:hypothetical protein